MINSETRNRFEYYLLYAIAFVLPLHKRMIPYVVGLFCVVFLFNGGLKRMAQNAKDRYLIFTTGFYAFLIIGVFYSTKLDEAVFDLEVKASLLMFPFIFSTVKLSQYSFSKILFWFIMGCAAAILVSITSALYLYTESHDATLFFYQKLSAFHHPSYFAMFLNFGIVCLYYFLVFDQSDFPIKSKFLIISIIVLFTLFIVLLSSKMSLITLPVLIIIGSLLWYVKNRSFIPNLIVLALFSAFAYGTYKYSNIVQVRIKEAVSSVSSKAESYSTTAARILIWKAGLNLIKEKPLLGYGTGDVKNELVKKYEENNFSLLAMHKLNAHNQFIQTLIAIGILGSLFFWAYLFYPLFDRSMFGNLVYLGFIALICINFLTESMLETQAGVVFFALFNSLLYFNKEKIIPFKSKKE